MDRIDCLDDWGVKEFIAREALSRHNEVMDCDRDWSCDFMRREKVMLPCMMSLPEEGSMG